MMDERLKRLKHSLDETALGRLRFSEEKMETVINHIRKQEGERDIDVLLVVFQLLVYKKNGHHLTQQLRVRGITRFDGEEGRLYLLLHKLENQSYLSSSWESDVKYYRLTPKGQRLLKKYETTPGTKKTLFQPLLESVIHV
ncbi:PadR family transcriptional regulator [Halobacillus sp. BAB-2008]|uniref:PadR family transcriptional regulator n=1 Tax=Halobacillus sp. BAB-2008 TaxID=1246484 RepID=UPI0002A520AF|nr:PadR family transcriptional regulator [Halobacillus sp. BAB-2008]ELK47083.1 lineage-specific thermal regulator protein [Halobacillus sp. BAB-2008]